MKFDLDFSIFSICKIFSQISGKIHASVHECTYSTFFKCVKKCDSLSILPSYTYSTFHDLGKSTLGVNLNVGDFRYTYPRRNYDSGKIHDFLHAYTYIRFFKCIKKCDSLRNSHISTRRSASN